MSDKKKPFIPAWLDDADLSPAEMRVFIHLLRSADYSTGIAWPSYRRMIKICGMGKSTIRRSIEELERRKFIEKTGKPFGGSCRYRVNPIVPSQGQLKNPNSSTSAPIESHPIVPSQDRNSPSDGTSIVSPEGQEGNPIRKPKSELFHFEESLPFDSEDFRDAWGDWNQHRKKIKKPLTPTSAKQQLKNFKAWGEARSIAAIRHTIGNGWQGIREAEHQVRSSNPSTAPGTILTGGRIFKTS